MHQAVIEQVRPAPGRTVEAVRSVDACVAGSRRRAFHCYRIPDFQIQTGMHPEPQNRRASMRFVGVEWGSALSFLLKA